MKLRRFKSLLFTLACLSLSTLHQRVKAQAGTLDKTFGDGGKVVTDFLGPTLDREPSLAVQTDGKLIVAGTARTYSNNADVAIFRVLPDGKLDKGFGDGGKVKLDFRQFDLVGEVAIQSDGKLVVGGTTSFSGQKQDYLLCRCNSDGTLDKSFNRNGYIAINMNGSNGQAYAIAIQADKKIIIAGQSGIARVNGDGSLDTAFGTSGIVNDNLGFRIYAIAFQSDGKFIVAGNTFGIARYNVNGTLDTNFSGDGKTTVPFTSSSSALSLAIQTDNRILAAGWARTPDGRTKFALSRLDSTGNLDKTFNGTGMATIDFGHSYARAHSIAIQADGKLVVAGQTSPTNHSYFALARLNTNGTLDSSFDSDGKTITQFESHARAYSISIQADAKIVAAGTSPLTDIILDDDFAIARYNSNGALDTTFNGNGKFTIGFLGSAIDFPRDLIAMQSDGKLLALGYSQVSGGIISILARYSSEGELDKSFNSCGFVSNNFGATAFFAQALALQADGKIMIAGYARTPTSGVQFDFALARYNSNGTLDTSFSGDGLMTTDFFSRHDYALGLAIQVDGKILVAGGALTSSNIWKPAFARYNTNGSLDLSFGTGGRITLASTSSDIVRKIAIDRDGKITALSDHFLFRLDSLGRPDKTFHLAGAVALPFSARDIAIQTDRKIVIAGGSKSSSNNDVLIARYNADGTPDSRFATSGVLNVDFGAIYSNANAVEMQSDGKILAAGFARFKTTGSDLALVRVTTDGQLDTTFGNTGKTTTDFGLYEVALSLSLQPDGKLVLLGATGTNPLGGTNFLLARYQGRKPRDKADAEASLLTVSDSFISSFGGVATVNVTPKDSNGQDLGADYDVVIHNTAGTLLSTVIEDNGIYSQDIQADSTADHTIITAEIDGVWVSTKLSVTFVHVHPSLSTINLSSYQTVKDSIVTVTVIPKDDKGLAVGRGHSVVIASSSGSLSGPVTDLGDGRYTQNLLATECTTAEITATVDKLALTVKANLTVINSSNLGSVIGFDTSLNLHSYASIQSAINSVVADRLIRILVSPGTYNEKVKIQGAACNGLRVEGLSAVNPVVIRSIELEECYGASFHHLTFDGGAKGTSPVRILRSASASIISCIITGAKKGEAGIETRKTSVLRLTDCLVRLCGGDGLSIDKNSLVTINRCLIESNGYNGIKIDKLARVEVLNSTIRKNGTTGDPKRGYGIYKKREVSYDPKHAEKTADPTRITLTGNTIAWNSGLPRAGRSTVDIGNYDQILDPSDT